METEIAELKRQLEVANEQADIHRQWNLGYMKSNDAHRTALLASQAREVIHREALLQMMEHAESYGKAWARAYVNEYRDLLPGSAKEQFDMLAVMHRRLDKVLEAIALPHDDTALKEYRDAVITQFVGEFKRHVGGDGEFWLHELEDYLDNLKGCV